MFRSLTSPFGFLGQSNHSNWLSATAVMISLSVPVGTDQISQAERAQVLAQQPTEHAFRLSLVEQHNDAEKLKYLITAERRALLNTIRYAEGTWKEGKDLGYRTIFGGGVFKDLSQHPDRVVVKLYSSAAAGAYQFIPTTWMVVAKELNLPNFQPQHQDQAALHLVSKRGALREIDSRGLTPSAMAMLAPEWASFPNLSGRSSYGQPVKSHAELAKFYATNLRLLQQQA
ncbi:MAG TPA: endolysin [Prochlorococcus sp.]